MRRITESVMLSLVTFIYKISSFLESSKYRSDSDFDSCKAEQNLEALDSMLFTRNYTGKLKIEIDLKDNLTIFTKLHDIENEF